jgi:predicted nucleic acid-binding protein
VFPPDWLATGGEEVCPRAICPNAAVATRSAKGTARTAERGEELIAPDSVLRELKRSAKGAARTIERGEELIAPDSVLRELKRSAKGAARTAEPGEELIAPNSVLRELKRRERYTGVHLTA